MLRRWFASSREEETASPTRLVFVHVPKCGGTSVDAALREALGLRGSAGWIDPGISRAEAALVEGRGVPERAIPRFLTVRQYLLTHHLLRGEPFISGHAPLHPAVFERFGATTPFVTVLRDPVERWISYYISNRLASEDPNIFPNRLQTGDERDLLEAFLGSPSAAYAGEFLAIFFGGHRPFCGADPSAAVGPAVALLRRLACVGDVGDLPGFARALGQALGLRVRFPHLNRSKDYRADAAPLAPLFTPAIRARIAALCAADLEIYRAIRPQPEDAAP